MVSVVLAPPLPPPPPDPPPSPPFPDPDPPPSTPSESPIPIPNHARYGLLTCSSISPPCSVLPSFLLRAAISATGPFPSVFVSSGDISFAYVRPLAAVCRFSLSFILKNWVRNSFLPKPSSPYQPSIPNSSPPLTVCLDGFLKTSPPTITSSATTPPPLHLAKFENLEARPKLTIVSSKAFYSFPNISFPPSILVPQVCSSSLTISSLVECDQMLFEWVALVLWDPSIIRYVPRLSVLFGSIRMSLRDTNAASLLSLTAVCGHLASTLFNSTHTTIHQGSSSYRYVSSALMAEALALRAAISAAIALEFSDVIINSDFLTLVTLLNSNEETNELETLLHDIRIFAASFSFIHFFYIKRTAIVVAVSLAKTALFAVNSTSQ